MERFYHAVAAQKAFSLLFLKVSTQPLDSGFFSQPTSSFGHSSFGRQSAGGDSTKRSLGYSLALEFTISGTATICRHHWCIRLHQDDVIHFWSLPLSTLSVAVIKPLRSSFPVTLFSIEPGGQGPGEQAKGDVHRIGAAQVRPWLEPGADRVHRGHPEQIEVSVSRLVGLASFGSGFEVGLGVSGALECWQIEVKEIDQPRRQTGDNLGRNDVASVDNCEKPTGHGSSR
jgi:hypothetical protein